MIPIIYIFLLSLMLFIMWRAGRELRIKYSMTSIACVSVVLAYTLNEGLRFGRGIDYNVYWNLYHNIENGWVINKEFLFQLLCKLFIWLNISFQGFVLFLSLIFIIGTLFLMKSYREYLPVVLPLFVLFSNPFVENMIRWYFAFSLFMIGLHYLLTYNTIKEYIIFSLLSCLIHTAFIPIPLIFYVVYRLNKVMLHPIISLPLFFVIYFYFESNDMLLFSNYLEFLSMNTIFETYSENVDYWLTGGFDHNERSGYINAFRLLLFSLITIIGYKVVHKKDRIRIFTYNIFVIGLLLFPISRKIELIDRYDSVFFFFRAMIMGYVVYFLCKNKSQYAQLFFILFVSLFLWSEKGTFLAPFRDNEKKYMYVWNQTNEKPNEMLRVWLDDIYKKSINSNK